MGPHSDFACLARACQVDGQASVYDLPVNATRCPVCGSKRLHRIWTAPPNISRGVAKHVDGTVEPIWEAEHEVRASAARADARSREFEDRARAQAAVELRSFLPHAVPTNIAGARIGVSASGGVAKQVGSFEGPLVSALKPRTTIVGRDIVKP